MSDELKRKREELIVKAAELRRATRQQSNPNRQRPEPRRSASNVSSIETLSKEEEAVREQYEKEVAEALAKNSTPEKPDDGDDDEDDTAEEEKE